MKWSRLIVAAGLLAAPVSAAKTAAERAAELQQVRADYAKACSGRGRDIDARFSEADGTNDHIRTAKGSVIFYREVVPESVDWRADDTYVFSAATGKRLQFTRAVAYAGEVFTYVRMIDANGRSTDNAHALPDGQFLTEEPIFATLKQACHFKPVKAGLN